MAVAATPIPSSMPSAPALLGESPSIVAVRQTVAQVAGTNLTVLLQGESGTGKEVVARLLGACSGRSSASFVKINCAAIPNELWESELFGYESGAFTGANRPKSGKFELAGGGTMFLDEISEMPLHLQAKLLQVLQDGEFSRLGGRRSLSVDVRVIAATNCDLHAAVAAGQFRQDLYYRLNVIAIRLPPLRQRRSDIPLLTDHFLTRYATLYQRQPPDLPAAVRAHMEAYDWPGNVRELENLIKRFIVLGDPGCILSEVLTTAATAADDGVPKAGIATMAAGVAGRRPPGSDPGTMSLIDIGRQAAQAAEREAILRVLEETRWNRRLAARKLRISYKGLQNKLKLLLDAPAAMDE